MTPEFEKDFIEKAVKDCYSIVSTSEKPENRRRAIDVLERTGPVALTTIKDLLETDLTEEDRLRLLEAGTAILAEIIPVLDKTEELST